MDQNFREFPVTIYGNLQPYNDVLSKARCRIFYKYGNRNGTYITDEFAEKLISSLPYAPVKGIFDGDDFTDHGHSRSLGRIYGIVPEHPNFAWEDHEDEDGVMRTYACADVYLFTALYSEAADIIKKPQSMELYEKTLNGSWQFVDGQKYFVFTDGCFLGLQALGDDVEPCFEGAAFYTLCDSFTKLIDKLEKLESFNLNSVGGQEGGTKMEKINFKLSDNTKFDMLWSLLNTNYNEENNWVVEYSICEIYDDYAVVRNLEAQKFERVYYTKDDSNDSLAISKREDCFIVDVTETEKSALDTIQKLNNGNYEKADEVYTAGTTVEEKVEEVKSEFSTKITDLENNVATLTTERDEANTNYANAQTSLEEAQTSLNSLKEENESLTAYKAGVEKTEKENIVASYTDLLDEETLNSFSAKLDDYTAEDLDKELAYALKKSNPSVFSKTSGTPLMRKDTPREGIEGILEKYRKN